MDKCQNRKVSELESVRIGTGQESDRIKIWKESESEMCTNWQVSE